VRSTLGVSKEELLLPACESQAVSAAAMSKYMQMWHSRYQGDTSLRCTGSRELMCASTSGRAHVHFPKAVQRRHRTFDFAGEDRTRNAHPHTCTSVKRHSTGGHLQVATSQLSCKPPLIRQRPQSAKPRRKGACSEAGSIADSRPKQEAVNSREGSDVVRCVPRF
jgi:hypothetical protein